MKIQFYEEVFEVTETLQNGKERKIKKSVLCNPFDGTKHRIELNRVEKAIEALQAEHYYNIVHIETKIKTLLFA